MMPISILILILASSALLVWIGYKLVALLEEARPTPGLPDTSERDALCQSVETLVVRRRNVFDADLTGMVNEWRERRGMASVEDWRDLEAYELQQILERYGNVRMGLDK